MSKFVFNSNKLVSNYMQENDWRRRENSNSTFSVQGLNCYISSEIIKDYWLNHVYDNEIRDHYRSGALHLHDLGQYASYCTGWDLAMILEEGFGGCHTNVESKPPKHFGTALGHLCNFMFTIQGECYSSDTEVLTESGWKLFKDVSLDEKVFTLNKETRQIELQHPVRKIENERNEELINFKNSRLDLLVTKNHNMLVGQVYGRKTADSYKLNSVRAKDFNPNTNVIPKNGIWKSKEKETFILPAITAEYCKGSSGEIATKTIPEKEFKMDVWLRFLGMYLSEGSCYKRNDLDKRRNQKRREYTVNIPQKKFYNEFKEVLDSLGFTYNETLDKNGVTRFSISNKQLYMYVQQFGNSKDRFVPQEIKDLSIEQLETFYQYMKYGDGTTDVRNGNEEYYTTSQKLADDMQEIFLKLGFSANIRKRTRGKYSWFIVAKSKVNNFKINKDDISVVPYKGSVYCLEVPNGTLYVRRNGKAAWCGNCAGAVAISSFDTYLAPFIRYDNLTEEEVYQELQEFVFNMNVPTRTGAQRPFTNVTLDIKVPGSFKDKPVLHGGELKEETYGEFQEEMDMFNRCLFKVFVDGDRSGRVFTFPIPTINVTKDFDWDNPNIDSLWEATAKYGLPYFANLVNSNINPDDIMSMCCRLRLSLDKLQYRGGGLFGSGALTGSCGVVTINLPQAALLSDNEDEFFHRVSSLMDLAKRSLIMKREKLEELTDMGLYPYAKHFLRRMYQRDGKYWNNHFSTIGIVGGNEACLNLTGRSLLTKEGQSLIERLLTFMNDKLVSFQEETGTYWNLEATPAEGTAHRLARRDIETFGDNIHYFGNKETAYYCNSTQIPVSYTDDIFELLEVQDKIQSMYTGGTVQHVYIGESQVRPCAVKNFVRKICENYKLPYVSVTPTFSVCKTHGYISGEHFYCPTCNSECEVYSRVVGYIRPVSSWNDGKRQEFKERKYFKLEGKERKS